MCEMALYIGQCVRTLGRVRLLNHLPPPSNRGWGRSRFWVVIHSNRFGSNFFLLYAASCVFVFFYDFVWNHFSRVESFSCVNSLTTKFTFSNSRNAMKCYIGGGFFEGSRNSLSRSARVVLCVGRLFFAPEGGPDFSRASFSRTKQEEKLSIVR